MCAARSHRRVRACSPRRRVRPLRANQAEVAPQIARTRVLVEHGASPRSALEDLEARSTSLRAGADAAQAEVRALQAEVEALRIGERETSILAPIAGTVLAEPSEVGEMVGPLVPILELADMTSLVVEIDVPEARLSVVRVGTPCEIVLEAFPGRRLRGEVLELGRRVNRQKATVPVKVRFVDPSEGVLPDMSARVSFLTEQLSETQLCAASRTIVPADAVIERGGRRVVMEIATGGLVHLRRVTLGEQTDDGFVLVDGPDPGTRLVQARVNFAKLAARNLARNKFRVTLTIALSYPIVEYGMGRWLEENMGGMFPYFRIEPLTYVVAILAAMMLGAAAAAIPVFRASRLGIVESLRRID